MGYEKPVDYNEVADRIADLKAVHPDAVLRPVNPHKPFEVVTIADKTFIVYTAACYRTPADPLPGIGVAWEPFPGRTPYTKDSELMNAETSAWGRSIVAALRSTSKKIASANEVRNRQADQEHVPNDNGNGNGRRQDTHSTVRQPPQRDHMNQQTGEVTSTCPKMASDKQIGAIKAIGHELGMEPKEVGTFVRTTIERDSKGFGDLSSAEASRVIKALTAMKTPVS